MPPRNRTKSGLTIPMTPKSKGTEALASSSTSSAVTSTTNAASPSPSRRTVTRTPRPQPSVRPIPPPPPPAPTRSTSQTAVVKEVGIMELEKEEAEKLESLVNAPQGYRKLMKQLSMNETSAAREIAWEKRRKQIIRNERRRNSISGVTTSDVVDPVQTTVTDADLHDLKGSIELGFGFKEEEGQKLCNTLPALDLYFAVNRKLSPSPVSTPRQPPSTPLSRLPSMSTPNSPRSDMDSWKICGPGDDPQQVKTKLRHWAQAVACSIIQSS